MPHSFPSCADDDEREPLLTQGVEALELVGAEPPEQQLPSAARPPPASPSSLPSWLPKASASGRPAARPASPTSSSRTPLPRASLPLPLLPPPPPPVLSLSASFSLPQVPDRAKLPWPWSSKVAAPGSFHPRLICVPPDRIHPRAPPPRRLKLLRRLGQEHSAACATGSGRTGRPSPPLTQIRPRISPAPSPALHAEPAYPPEVVPPSILHQRPRAQQGWPPLPEHAPTASAFSAAAVAVRRQGRRPAEAVPPSTFSATGWIR